MAEDTVIVETPVETPAAPATTETPSEPEKAPEAPATTESAPEVDPGMTVPETPEGYSLPVPEGDNGEFAKTASAWFHEAGIPPAQAEKLAAKWNEFAAAQQAEAKANEEAAEAQAEARYKEEDTALRKEWGDKYDSNIELGKRAYREFGFDAELVDAMEAKVGPAKLFKLFASIGQKIGEDTALGLGNSNVSNTTLSHAERMYGNKVSQ
jgi:hypothetical protein